MASFYVVFRLLDRFQWHKDHLTDDITDPKISFRSEYGDHVTYQSFEGITELWCQLWLWMTQPDRKL